MNVSLTPRLEELVKHKVETGLYNSSSEVIREALRLMERIDRNQEDTREAALQEVRQAVQAGVDSGEGRPFDESLVADICARGRERLAAHRAKK